MLSRLHDAINNLDLGDKKYLNEALALERPTGRSALTSAITVIGSISAVLAGTAHYLGLLEIPVLVCQTMSSATAVTIALGIITFGVSALIENVVKSRSNREMINRYLKIKELVVLLETTERDLKNTD